MFGYFNVGNNPVAATGGEETDNSGYNFIITNSCRFNDDDTAYFTRTPGTASNRRTWTFSAWVKRSKVSGRQTLFGSWDTVSNQGYLQYGLSNDQLTINNEDSGGAGLTWSSLGDFRDPTGWHHLVWKYDTTQTAAHNRAALYIDGLLVDMSVSGNAALNGQGSYNGTWEHRIGRQVGSTNYFDGYMADVNFVDGQALGPEYFGEFNSHGLWIPVDTASTIADFGLNGFRLEFKNSAALGTDTAPLAGAHVSANTWTPSGIASTDQMIDSPTLSTLTDTGNYCTWNPIGTPTITSTYSDGNLVSNGNSAGTMAVRSGKYYFEINVTGSGQYNFGMIQPSLSVTGSSSLSPAFSIRFGTSASNTEIYKNGSAVQSGANITPSGFVVGIEVNLDDGEAKFYVNGTQQLATLTGITLGDYYTPYVEWHTATNLTTLVAREDDWSYSPSSSVYKSLNTANLPEPTINDTTLHFDTVLYTGNGVADRKIKGLKFKPDLVWIDDRDAANDHMIYDSIRGAHLSLSTNTNAGETNDSGLTSFNNDGFTIGTLADVNTDTNRYVAWCWNAGNLDPVQNNNGTIQSTVKANTAAGFAMIGYHGNSVAGATVGHGLSQTPEFVWVKNRGATVESPMVDFVAANRRNYFFPAAWAGTAVTRSTDVVFRTHTASVLQWGADPSANTDYDYIAYCWHSVPGFSKIGYYTGNGSATGPFVYTGFKPAFVLFKATAGSTQFVIRDNKRDYYNESIQDALPSATTVEPNNSGDIDFLATGFKLKGTGTTLNATSGQFFYFAIAESPFKYTTVK